MCPVRITYLERDLDQVLSIVWLDQPKYPTDFYVVVVIQMDIYVYKHKNLTTKKKLETPMVRAPIRHTGKKKSLNLSQRPLFLQTDQ